MAPWVSVRFLKEQKYDQWGHWQGSHSAWLSFKFLCLRNCLWAVILTLPYLVAETSLSCPINHSVIWVQPWWMTLTCLQMHSYTAAYDLSVSQKILILGRPGKLKIWETKSSFQPFFHLSSISKIFLSMYTNYRTICFSIKSKILKDKKKRRNRTS